MSLFLTDIELIQLTGCKRKANQISQLRIMGLPFFVNAAGQAIVTRKAVEGGDKPERQAEWIPAALRRAA